MKSVPSVEDQIRSIVRSWRRRGEDVGRRARALANGLRQDLAAGADAAEVATMLAALEAEVRP